jgi:hypothetical protein
MRIYHAIQIGAELCAIDARGPHGRIGDDSTGHKPTSPDGSQFSDRRTASADD